jgi:hypothetical protein
MRVLVAVAYAMHLCLAYAISAIFKRALRLCAMSVLGVALGGLSDSDIILPYRGIAPIIASIPGLRMNDCSAYEKCSTNATSTMAPR